jgi:hypothetical protein
VQRHNLLVGVALLWLVAWPLLWFSLTPDDGAVVVLEVPHSEAPILLPAPLPPSLPPPEAIPEIIYMPLQRYEPEVMIAAGGPKPEPSSKPEPAPTAAKQESIPDAPRRATQLRDVHVAEGEELKLPRGDVRVSGTWDVSGSVDGENSRLIFDGENQLIRGNTELTNAVFRGGTKRVQGRVRVGRGANAARPGEARFVVEPGTTVILEQGSSVRSDGRHGYQIGGELILDGGTFSGGFAHGNGVDWSEAWLPGSRLTVNSGRFIGRGDHNFSGAEITIHGGAVTINDDIWHSGEKLTMYGGTFRNNTRGGWFWLNGEVNLYGGVLRAYQHRTRGLGIHADANVLATNAVVEIRGRDATANASGIRLHGNASINTLNVRVNTIIHHQSRHDAWFSVANLRIWNRKRFEARGFHLAVNLAPNNRGTYVQ